MASSYKVDAKYLLHKTPVYMLGFVADLASLYSHGWEVQVESRADLAMFQAVFVNKHMRLAGFLRDFDLMQSISQPLHVNHIYQTHNTTVMLPGPARFRSYSPVDFVDLHVSRMPEEVRLHEVLELEESKELVVDPNEVQSLLDRIVEVQRPKQAEIRDRSRKTIKHTQAKIITLAEYA